MGFQKDLASKVVIRYVYPSSVAHINQTLHLLPTRLTKPKSALSVFDVIPSLVFPTRFMLSRCMNVSKTAVNSRRELSVIVIEEVLPTDIRDPRLPPMAPRLNALN